MIENIFITITEGNRTNQCNPTHTKSGPGHTAEYKGTATKPDLSNHSKQMNPNNTNYRGSKKWIFL